MLSFYCGEDTQNKNKSLSTPKNTLCSLQGIPLRLVRIGAIGLETSISANAMLTLRQMGIVLLIGNYLNGVMKRNDLRHSESLRLPFHLPLH